MTTSHCFSNQNIKHRGQKKSERLHLELQWCSVVCRVWCVVVNTNEKKIRTPLCHTPATFHEEGTTVHIKGGEPHSESSVLTETCILQMIFLDTLIQTAIEILLMRMAPVTTRTQHMKNTMRQVVRSSHGQSGPHTI